MSEAYRGKINWKKPDAAAEHGEVHHQADASDTPDWAKKRLTQLKSRVEYNKAMKTGKRKVYSRRDVRNTGNTGERWSETEKDDKKRRAPTLYGKKKKVERSIVLKNPKTGERHLVAGHHCATYVTDVMKRPTEVHEIT